MLSYAHLAVTKVEIRHDQGDEIARRHGQPMVSTACGKQVTNTLATRREDLVRCDDCLAAMATRPKPTKCPGPPHRGHTRGSDPCPLDSAPYPTGGAVMIETALRGEWMQTFTGRAFYPMAPLAEDVDPVDIAHALSMICRYGGHTKVFYSVAEHCVLMSFAVTPENALWALLHDATEAYMLDLIRPIKQMMPAYREAEARLSDVIADRFGISRICPAEVEEADLRILHDERDVLMVDPPQSWGSLDGVKPLGVQVTGWAPEYAERQYLDRLRHLTNGSYRSGVSE